VADIDEVTVPVRLKGIRIERSRRFGRIQKVY
jgi:hypothetical protein